MAKIKENKNKIEEVDVSENEVLTATDDKIGISAHDYDSNVYSPDMLKELEKRSSSIKTALTIIDRNFEKITFDLYWIYKNDAYKCMGFESIIDYAENHFGFKKSTTYNFIRLAERFGKPCEDKNLICFDDKYKDYSSSKLSLLIDKSDSEIESMEIKPDMSVSEIKKQIKKHDAVSSLPDSLYNPDASKNNSDAQEELVIDNNEVSLPDTSSDFLDFDVFKPDEFFDIDCGRIYISDLIEIIREYANKYYDNFIPEVDGALQHKKYKVVRFTESRHILRIFIFDGKNISVYDVSYYFFIKEKLNSFGLILTASVGKKKLGECCYINLNYIYDMLYQYPDCKITISLSNNKNTLKGGEKS